MPTRGFGRPFLALPFARAAARRETWGSDRVVLAYAGRRFRFTGLTPEQAGWLRDRYEPMVRDAPASGRRPATVQIHRAPAGAFVPYRRHRSPASLVLGHDPAAVRMAGLFLYGHLRRSAVCADAFPRDVALEGAMWLSAPDRRSFEWGFENYLRVLLAYRAAADGGALLHSAAIRRRGGVSLFFGHSGDGKTTLSERFAAMGFDVLGDDLNVLTPSRGGDGYRVCPMPYAGAFGRAGLRLDDHPLGATLRLQQAARGQGGAVRRMRPAEAVGHLLACAPFVNGDPHWRRPFVANLARLASMLPPERIALALGDDPARILGVAAS